MLETEVLKENSKKELKEKVNFWLMAVQDKIPTERIGIIKSNIEKADESKIDNIMALELKSPMTIFLLAWFVGWLSLDRFLLGSTGVGIARILTLHGLGIWWLVDLITSMKRTKEYNFRKIQNYLGHF